jgi:hypothetical protein
MNELVTPPAASDNLIIASPNTRDTRGDFIISVSWCILIRQ